VRYLRRSVVVRSRSIRGRPMADLAASGRGPRVPGARQQASTQESSARQASVLAEASPQAARSAVISALRRLPARQREALVLRFYLDLSPDRPPRPWGSARPRWRHTAWASSPAGGPARLGLPAPWHMSGVRSVYADPGRWVVVGLDNGGTTNNATVLDSAGRFLVDRLAESLATSGTARTRPSRHWLSR
jgi:hypothetical protein